MTMFVPIRLWPTSTTIRTTIRQEYGMSPGCSLCLHLANSWIIVNPSLSCVPAQCLHFYFTFFFVCSEQILLVCFGLGAASSRTSSGHTRTAQKSRKDKLHRRHFMVSIQRRSEQHFVFILAHAKIHISHLDASLDLCLWPYELNSCQRVYYIRFNEFGVCAQLRDCNNIFHSYSFEFTTLA